jgi:protoheme ferro-lyase
VEHFSFAWSDESFAGIDCLNDSDAEMRVIEAMVSRELSGWI